MARGSGHEYSARVKSMSRFEFKVIPSPRRPRKLEGLEKDLDKFCATMTDIMTDMGLEGWEFIGAETIQDERRALGIFSRVSDKSCLVFRRPISKLDEKVEAAVKPRRVARSHVVARVREGQRRIRLSLPAPSPEELAAQARA